MSIDNKFDERASSSPSLEKTPPQKGINKVSLSGKLKMLYKRRDKIKKYLGSVEEALKEYEVIAFEFNNLESSKKLKSSGEYEITSDNFHIPKGFYPDPDHPGMFNKSPDHTRPDPPRGLYKDLENPGQYGRTIDLTEEKRERLKELALKGVWW